MATIREKGPSQYHHVQIRRKGFPTQSKTFPTRRDAEDWAKVIESEMIRGVFVDRAEAESTTLKMALERYQTEVTASKKGKRQEAVRIRRWLEHPLAKRSLVSIRGADIAKFRDDWRKARNAENTIRLEMSFPRFFVFQGGEFHATSFASC